MQLGGVEPGVEWEELQRYLWVDGHWVLVWCEERDRKASDNHLAVIPSNMGCEICASVDGMEIK